MRPAIPLSARPRVYIAAVASAATVIAAAVVYIDGPPTAQLGMAAVMLGMAIVATQFPLQVTPSVKVNTTSVAYFAAVLILDPSAALLVVGGSQMVGGLILAQRRNPVTGRPRRRLVDTVFNASQWMLATTVAALIFRGEAGPPNQGLRWFLAASAAAVTMYCLNTTLVAGIAALHRGLNPLETWLVGRRRDVYTEVGLYMLGATASVAAPEHPWVLLGLVIPTVLLHNSLQKTLQLQRQTVEAVEQMADLVDLRDGYTGQHSERVAEHAEGIGKRLRLSADDVATIRLAARVHDIGKIAIPDGILHKPGRLDANEWELMKRHVEAGCRVLERFAEYQKGLELVRAHHERVDGSGYPRGLKGDEIPLGAQVIGIADSIDAMTSDRPYRRAMPFAAIVSEIERAPFSPEVVAVALDMLGVIRTPVRGRGLVTRGAVT